MQSEQTQTDQLSLTKLQALARRVDLRLRLRTTLAFSARWLLVPLLAALAALTYIKALRPALEVQQALLVVAAALGLLWLLSTLVVWFRPRAPNAGSLAIDRHYGLQDRVTNALAFQRLSDDQRTPLMHAAIGDAQGIRRQLRPPQVAPLHVPQELLVAIGLVAAIFGLSRLEVRTQRLVAPTISEEKLSLPPDDLALFREVADELEHAAKDPENLATARQFNQLIQDMAERRLTRREAFARLGRLERELGDAADADRDALDEGLKNLARELEQSELSKPLADALDEKRLLDAEKALRELAEKLKKKKDKPSKQQLDSLRRALQRASQTTSERLKNIEARRKELEAAHKSLLKKREEQKKLTPGEQQQLDQHKRELERLDRAQRGANSAKRQLSQLDRELAEAAAALMREMGASAQDLEQAAQDVNRMAQDELTQQEKQALKKRLQELQELLRQQGKGGQTLTERLVKFGRRARGASSAGDQQGGQGDKAGKGSGRAARIAGLELGRGQGAGSIPIPGGMSPGSGAPGAEGAPPGSNNGNGPSWGSGHDPNLRGAESGVAAQTHDVTAAAVDTGQGDASAEVIFSAAQRGFTGQNYGKVFTDYHTVAEELLTDDEIPPGHRFYVQRYFQLIRPRD